MDTAAINESDRIGYLGKLMALIRLYLEFNLSVTDAILAAESDLVTWNAKVKFLRIHLLPKTEKQRSPSLFVH